MTAPTGDQPAQPTTAPVEAGQSNAAAIAQACVQATEVAHTRMEAAMQSAQHSPGGMPA